MNEKEREIKRPVATFAYVFGTSAALIMGIGMSISMTQIGGRLDNALVVGAVIGAIGLLMAVINYPIYNKILGWRRKKYEE